jgi:hypothetical protein
VKRLAVALSLALAACAPTPDAAPPPTFAPDANGIAILGQPQRIDFGRSQEGVVAAVTRLEGRGPAATTVCPGGATAVRWPSGLSLHFTDGAFLGWANADGTAAGLPCA